MGHRIGHIIIMVIIIMVIIIMVIIVLICQVRGTGLALEDYSDNDGVHNSWTLGISIAHQFSQSTQTKRV